jgi:putative N6-adenine-specific DNA methylase
MILTTGWALAPQPLIDPFCGSGTVPIEAALVRAGAPAGVGRAFRFQEWPSFQPGTWASVRAEAEQCRRLGPPTPVPAPLVAGRDRDRGAVRAARANADRAGVAGAVAFDVGAISTLESPAGDPGWVISNPPYGKRVASTGDLRDLYARTGDVLRTRFAGWHVGLLVSDVALAGHTGLRWEERWRSTNGGIPVRFLTTPHPV